VVIGLALGFAVLQGDDTPEPRLLNLDVIAVDNHGQPVSDLTADDFVVADANKPQKLTFFRHRDATLWQTPRLAPHEVSNRGRSSITHATVILFDLMNEAFGTRGSAADQIVKCLEQQESADDVYLYLLTVEGRIFGVRGLPGAEEVSESGEAWNKKIKPLLDRAQRDVMRMRPIDVDVAVRVQLTFAALDALGAQLSRVPGRKNVVWVTDGVPIALGAGRSDIGEPVDFTEQLRQMSEGFVRSGMALYPVRQLMIGTPDRIGETSGGAGATYPGSIENPQNAGAGRGGNLGNNVGAGSQSLQTLNLLADMTGGRQSAGKDTCGALKQARSDDRVSYQIGYFPPESNWDGKYHKLKVACRRKGVRIQAKAGYFAWGDAPGAGAEQAIRSVSTTEFDAAEIGLRGLLAANPKDAQAADITARIDARDLALVQQGGRYNAELRIAIVGQFADGHVEITKVIPFDRSFSAGERDEALRDGIAFSREVSVKDVSKVRLIVYDRNSTAIGSLTIPMNAPRP
jgi:VWFA-related protein